MAIGITIQTTYVVSILYCLRHNQISEAWNRIDNHPTIKVWKLLRMYFSFRSCRQSYLYNFAVLLCPSTIPNGELAQSCQRRVGNSCTFTCSGSHRPSTSQNLFCTSKGTWSENIDLLCKRKTVSQIHYRYGFRRIRRVLNLAILSFNINLRERKIMSIITLSIYLNSINNEFARDKFSRKLTQMLHVSTDVW